MIIQRRKFLTGLVSLFAAPAIVKYDNLMPVKLMLPGYDFDSFDEHPEGWGYQWNNPEGMYAGWHPVPASRYSGKFSINGPFIERGNLILMEKPKEIIEADIREMQYSASRMSDGYFKIVEAQSGWGRKGFNPESNVKKGGKPDIFYTMDWAKNK